ncbi:MAG: TIGR00730 family Rossman fold protein [Candidatus Sulfotelmatobacter sp.]
MNSVCVFCGSSSGRDAAYEAAARATGHSLARSGLRLVYGGGKVGLMGVLADTVLSAGGQVTGVIPRALFDREIAHSGVRDMRVVQSMHERKELMASLADAFIALPGGAGTLEEIFEQWTWAQLGIHAKPCGFLNVNGYFDPLFVLIGRMVAEGFMARAFAAMLAVETDPDRLLAGFRAYQPPPQKWALQNDSLAP